MFSFSPGQGVVDHILVISYGIIVGNYVKRKKKWCLIKKMGKVAKGEKKKQQKKRKKKKKKKVFLYVLKILCWKSLKSKEVKHWCLKMENLCALMEYLVWNIIFQNALLFLVWTFPCTFFFLTLTLAPLQPENKIFWFMHCL